MLKCFGFVALTGLLCGGACTDTNPPNILFCFVGDWGESWELAGATNLNGRSRTMTGRAFNARKAQPSDFEPRKAGTNKP